MCVDEIEMAIGSLQYAIGSAYEESCPIRSKTSKSNIYCGDMPSWEN